MPRLLKTPRGSLVGLRNAPVVPRGVKERPWGPFFDQKLSGFRIHNANAGPFWILNTRMQGTGEGGTDSKSKMALHRTIANPNKRKRREVHITPGT
jgi:hypothetical protein